MTHRADTAAALVGRWCRDRPSAVALELPDGGTRTYAELRRRVGQVAARLGPHPPGTPPTVAVDLPNGLDFCAAVVAVLGSGAVLVTVDRSLPDERTAAMLSLAAPRTVVTDRPDDRIAGWVPGHAAVVRLPPADALPATDDWLPEPAAPDDPAYVIFTSGTTGAPKATLNTHAGLLNHLLFMADVCPLPAGSRVLMKSARSFDAWILEFFWALTQGLTLVLADQERAADARYLADLLTTGSVHGLVGVPSLLQRVFSVVARTGAAVPLRIVVSAGEPLTAGLANHILTTTDARLFNFYGPSEAAIDVAYCAVENPPVADPLPIGRPIPGNRLTVRDAAGNDVTLSGEHGELVVSGTHVGLGYVGDERATAARFGTDDGERRYSTGDLAHLGPDKNFYVGGRMDTQVKINGVRIETAEIEACLLRHDTVADCSVQVTRSGDVPILVAFVQADGKAAPKSEYINFLRRSLPPVMVPSAYVFLTEFKHLPSGKKDTSRLEFPRGLPTVTAVDFEEPDGPLEQQLAGVWEAALGVAPIGARDEFALLGGESLKMIDVLVEVSDSVYPDVFTLGITRLSTVRDLAQKIQQAQKE